MPDIDIPNNKNSGLIGDIKQHRTEVIFGGIGLLVTVFLYLKSHGSSGSASSGTGNLNTSGSTTVSTDMLSSAMQQMSQQEQSDINGLAAQLGALASKINGSGSGSQTGQTTGGNGNQNPPSGNSSSSSGFGNGPMNPPVVSNNPPPNPALTARNLIGDNTITSFFKNLGLPNWVGLLYVGQKYNLPWQPGEPAPPGSANIVNFQNWMVQNGLGQYNNGQFSYVTTNDPNSQTCYAVNCATVPAPLQNIINQAYK